MLSQRLQFSKQAVRRLNVSAKDGSGRVSSLTVRVHGGSRYATKDGVSHLLSRFNFHNTGNKSALRFVRESELLGGRFSSAVDREYITLSTVFLKENLPYYVNALADVLYRTSFRPHELPESVLPAAKHDLMVAESDPVFTAQELLYNASFRNGLGNPLLYDGVEKVSLEDIKSFADKVYTSGNLEIIGQGVNEADLKRFVNDSSFASLPSGSSSAAAGNSKTYFAESRLRRAGSSVAAIAVPVSNKEFAMYEVLSRYLTSSLYKHSALVSKAKFDRYPDCGLFTLYVKNSDAAIVSNNIKTIVSDLTAGKDISVANKYASLQIALHNESALEPVELELNQVKNFKLGNFSYAAVGDVTNLPHAEELK